MDILKKFSLFLAALGGTCGFAFAQGHDPDTVVLPGVEIHGKIPPRQMGIREGRIDTLSMQIARNGDISEALLSGQGLPVKTYGPGTVKTLSVRGHSASQTRILWNGIPVNSPTLGLSDLSNLPVIAVDKAEVRYGAAGGGAIGAEIHLDIEPADSIGNELALLQEYSGLHAYNLGLKARAKAGPLGIGVRFYRHNAKNDYLYHDNSASGPPYPLERRADASLEMSGVIIDIAVKPFAQTEITAGFWDHDSWRLIPQSLLAAKTDANEKQNDIARRFYFRLRQGLGKGVIDARVGISSSEMEYTNVIAGIFSPFNTNTIFQTLNYSHDLGSQLRIRLEQEFDNTSASSYYYSPALPEPLVAERNMLAFGASVLGELKSGPGYYLMFRQGVMNGKLLPSTASAGVNYMLPLSFPLEAHLNLSRLHRIPTMNDLYWIPGGDPDLEAELGYQGEFGLKHKTSGKTHYWLEAHIFYSKIDGWIQWLPHPQNNYWTARNLKQVENKGLEGSAGLVLEKGPWLLNARVIYTYTHSSVSEAAFDGDLSPGKQLLYVPKHSGISTWWLQRGIYFARLSTPFVGKRFTNIDNTRYMPAHFTADAGAGIRKSYQTHVFELQFECNNLLNRDYQVIAWYPMPLRYYSVSLNLHFQNL